jgi:hypothetical protein
MGERLNCRYAGMSTCFASCWAERLPGNDVAAQGGPVLRCCECLSSGMCVVRLPSLQVMVVISLTNDVSVMATSFDKVCSARGVPCLA